MYNTFFNGIIRMVMVMFNYESLVGKMQRITESKSEEVVYCNNITNNWKALGIVLVILYFLFLLVPDRMIVIFIYMLLLIFIFLFIALRRGSILLDEDKIFIVLFKPFGLVESKVYVLPLSRVRYLDVKGNILFRKVKISFISDEGRLTKLHLRFASILYSPGSKDYKPVSNSVFNKLKEIQRVIDKGDF